MTYDDHDNHGIDNFIAKQVVNLSQGSSRRGFLARIGKLTLVALGVTTVEILPVDRTTPVEAASACDDYRLCGIYGRICTCCNNGNPITVCPYGVTQYSYWEACCSGRRIRYWDCCFGNANCSSCQWCYRNPTPQPLWCGGAGSSAYKCTAIVDAGAC